MSTVGLSGSKVFSNVWWKFCETYGVQIIQIVLSIILARLLTPNDYGMMAIVFICINFISIFIQSGINSALIFKKEISKTDFISALWANIGLSLFFAGIIAFGAEQISLFYKTPALKGLIQVASLSVPLMALTAVYESYAAAKSQFKKLFIRNLVAAPISGILGIASAYWGFGVWALIVQQLSYAAIMSLVLVLSIKIDGKGTFSFKTVRSMLSFGTYTVLSTFIAFISDNISDALIGKKIDSKDLGLYNKGNRFPGLIAGTVNSVIAGVMFPAFVSYRDNVDLLKEKSRKASILLSYLLFPLLLGFAVCAKPFVIALLTDKWVDSVPVIQLCCLMLCTVPFLQTMSQVYLALGNVKVRVLGEFIKLILTVTLLLLTLSHGITAIAGARVLVAFFMIAFTIIVNKILINYHFKDFLADYYKPLLCSVIMCLCIYPLLFINLPNVLVLILQCMVGVVVYISLLKLFKINEFEYIRQLIFSKFTKK